MSSGANTDSGNLAARIDAFSAQLESILSSSFSSSPATAEEQIVIDRILEKLERLRALNETGAPPDSDHGQMMRTNIMRDLQASMDEIEAFAAEALA